MKFSVKKLTLALLNVMVVSTLSACGSGGGDDPKPDPHPDPVVKKDKIQKAGGDDIGVTFEITKPGDIFTGKPYIISYSITPSLENSSEDEDSDTLTVTAKYGVITDTNPLTGEKAEIGQLFYYLPEDALKDSAVEFYRVNEELTAVYGEKGTALYSWYLGTENEHSDRLFTDQWHLKNLGQNPFSVVISPVKGIDLNVVPAWHLKDLNDELISGKKVVVGVYDSPVDFQHEDLKAQKYEPSGKIPSYINSELSLDDVRANKLNLHGVAVAGIIAATANNGKGGRGIAFDASVMSFDFMKASHGSVAKYPSLNVVNASISYDSSYAYEPDFESAAVALLENNTAYVKSMGNSFGNITYQNPNPKYFNKTCVEYNVNCMFKQNSSLERSMYTIRAGAINSLGKKSSYSSTGSNIWVSATGGEFGYDDWDSDSSAAIVTTLSRFTPDQYDDWDKLSPWRDNNKKYKERQFYTHTMNGTSSSSPSVAGVSALVIQAKPGITVPQLRYILAVTANNDRTAGWSSLSYSPVEHSVPEYNSENITFDNGWYTNGAGLRFSNYYGYGVVNAKKAVEKALDCNSDDLCAKRAELPDDYVSTNSRPCVSSDGGYNVTCTFTGFKGVENSETPSSEIEVDNMRVNLVSFGYTSETTDSTDVCYLASRASYDGLPYANSLLEIKMRSPSGTDTVIKPVYSNWDFEGHEYAKDYPDGDFMINTSDYLAEKVAATDTFTMKFKSVCPIDLDFLNSKISAVVTGYTD